MRLLFIKIGFIFTILAAGVYSTTFYISDYQSLGNDFNPPIPEFTSTRLSNDLSSNDDFHEFDRQINNFINKWSIAGASISIAKDGKLLYAKGYGYSDKETQTVVEPYNLFRIASMSKLVTAVGIMKLIDNNMLTLNSPVFGSHGVLCDSVFLNYVDKNAEKITVKNLLEHSGGWTSRYGDHMFMPLVVSQKLNKPLPVNVTDIIEFALSTRLHYQPGTQSSYLNLGYAILGKVIEKASGMDYETYIKNEVLYPLGIFDMKIGGSFVWERDDLEVKYYEPSTDFKTEDYTGSGTLVSRSYGGNDIKTLGAAGGWIASSTDLMKLLLAIDGDDAVNDIISKEAINNMVNLEDPHMSPLGWRKVKQDEWIRTGTLASTSALMVHHVNGLSYVVILNSGSWKGPEFTTEIERQMQRSIKSISEWPEKDLFYDNTMLFASHTKRKVVVF